MSVFSSHMPEDLEDLLALILKRAGLKTTSSASKQLLKDAEESVYLYHQEKTSAFHQGPSRTALLRLWKTAEKGSDKETLQSLLENLPAGAVYYLEQRAARIGPSLNIKPIGNNGLLDWADTASNDDLIKLIIFCAAEGRQIVQGRKRPKGLRSRNRIEPVILGIADRATIPESNVFEEKMNAQKHSPPNKAGRSRIDEKITLIAMLATDWIRQTGSVPIGGRGDASPFTDFVTSVFEWAKIGQPEHAIRIYWEEMKERKARS
jgi:hypothetical protein